MSAISFQHYLDVASSRDVPTLKRRLEDFAQRLEFPLFNAYLVVEQAASRPHIVDLRNAPESWAASTTDIAAARRDPIVQRMKTATAPVVYDQEIYVDQAAGDLWEEQAAHGYRTGISMVLHLNAGRHFVFGVDRQDPLPSNQDELIRLMADLQLLTVYAQETAFRLLLPDVSIANPIPKLTARELEILKWTLAGKSSAVIGQLLSISLSTVNFHLHSAMAKLGVSSKHQAAAKAQSLGLL